MLEKIKNLIDVKSIVTLGVIGAFIAMMFIGTKADDTFVELFKTIAIAVVTYYFAKPTNNGGNSSNTDGAVG